MQRIERCTRGSRNHKSKGEGKRKCKEEIRRESWDRDRKKGERIDEKEGVAQRWSEGVRDIDWGRIRDERCVGLSCLAVTHVVKVEKTF